MEEHTQHVRHRGAIDARAWCKENDGAPSDKEVKHAFDRVVRVRFAKFHPAMVDRLRGVYGQSFAREVDAVRATTKRDEATHGTKKHARR